MKRGAVALIAAAFAILGPALAAGAAQTWQASQDDALLFQLHVKQYTLEGDIRGYRTDRGICLDLGDTIQTLDLPIRLDKKSRRATGWLFAEDQTFTIDRDSNTVQIVNKHENLAEGELYDTPEGWCVDTNALSSWFGVEFTADPYNLLLKLKSEQDLPFIQAIERRSRAARLRSKKQEFDLSKLPQADLPYRGWRTPAVDMVVNFKVNHSPGGGSQANFNYELYASGEVLGASFDARLASDPTGVPRSLRLEAYRYDPDGGLLGPLKATRVAIGDVETEASSLEGRSAVGRGAIITNKPLQRPTSFSTTTIRGTMPSGWDAELYRNGQLIAFQGGSFDGRYDFSDVDLLFGDNDFEVVLYGPQGQIRRVTNSVPVGMDSIKPGKTYYWASVIEQGRDLLGVSKDIVDANTGWRWGVGVERGLDDRTSAAVTTQSMVVRGTRRDYLELNLRRALGSMLVELSAAQSFGQGRAYQAQALGKIGNVRFQAETLWIEGDYESDIVDPAVRGQASFSVDTSLKSGRVTIPLQFAARREYRRDGSKVNEWLIRGSLITPKISFTAELGQQWTEKPYGPPASGDGLRLDLLTHTRIGKVDLRGEARFHLTGPNNSFESASIIGEVPVGERSDLRAQVEYFGLSKRADFNLAYIRTFKSFSLQANARIGSDGSFGAGLSLAASVGPDPAHGGVRFSSEKLARTGQTAVTVFLDDNGDGRLSPGEKPVEGVSVEAGQHASDTPTDKSGRTIIDGIPPYKPVLISVDAGSLPDPFLQPTGKGVVVTPRPGIAASVQLPLAQTGEIEGTIYDLSGAARAGVELELVDTLGDVVATTISEFDGYFLFDLVPYGKYSIRLSSGSAKALSAARGIASEFEISNGNDVARLGIVRLKPDRVAQGGEPAGSVSSEGSS